MSPNPRGLTNTSANNLIFGDFPEQILGRLGPGESGPGHLGPGQLGPGQLGPVEMLEPNCQD